MQSDQPALTNKKIFLFWMPLAATWLMMALEGPFLAAIIARMVQPKPNLAAYGVAYAFALFFEAPVIMMLTAATALIKNKHTFLKLRRFAFGLNMLVTLTIATGILPPVFDVIAIDWIGLPPAVAALTHKTLIVLLPWPAAIGYRRFYQGVLIRAHYTRRVAYGTAIRLTAMSLVALFCYLFTEIDGAITGAAALTIAVCVEAIASRLMARQVVRAILAQEKTETNEQTGPGYREIAAFYYPLALTSMLGLGVNPIMSFFIGQSRFAIESLAVLPVVNSLVFIFRSLGLAFQETGIALMGERYEGFLPLRHFARWLGITIIGVLALIAFTPAATFWYHSISGLSLELTRFAITPTRILAIIPGLTLLLTFQRSVLVTAKSTRPVTIATLIEVIAIIALLLLTTRFLNMVGVTAAALAYVIGRLGANAFLMWPYSKILSTHKKTIFRDALHSGETVSLQAGSGKSA
jgi:Na+-driven multidrug efflux pump